MNKIPNWVYSSLTIIGDEKDLIKFKNFAKSETNPYNGAKELDVLDTNKFIPYPKRYLDLDINPKTKIQTNELGQKFSIEGTDGYNNGGYEWCLKNLGTKWGICSAVIDEDINKKENCVSQLKYNFETAWSPCFPVIRKMSRLFPKLKFIYFCEEESYAFKFQQEYKKGKIINEKDLNIQNNDN